MGTPLRRRIPLAMNGFCSSGLLQITQQPLKRVLVGIVLLPAGEVSNAASVANVVRPLFGYALPRVFLVYREKLAAQKLLSRDRQDVGDAYREQHCSAGPLFLAERGASSRVRPRTRRSMSTSTSC